MTPADDLPARANAPIALRHYFLLSYVLLALNAALGVDTQAAMHPGVAVYCVLLYLTYPLIYLLPAILITYAARFASTWRVGGEGARWQRRGLIGVAVGTVGLAQIFVFADRTIFRMFGFHINGFVWNLVTTPGGVESLGASQSSMVTYAAVFVAIFLLQGLVASLTIDGRWSARMSASLAPRKYGVLLLVFLVATIAERLTYGISDLRSFTRLPIAADSVPLHLRLSIRSFAKSIGVEGTDEGETIDVEWSHLDYPRNELDPETAARHPNIVWLTSESLRADMLVPEIMPGTWDFAAQAHRFAQHYSGGKGTRMGMFSMFYGLYGSYWWAFLKERRGPVLFDVLHRLGYEFDLRTSARFTYPEFDMTLFASFQEDELHEAQHGEGWERDRQNVDSLLEFLDRRDPTRPFMAFQFFESPHANYYFPPESVIRPDYLPDLNYATMDVDRDIGQIKNRYINAVHHLDQQISRVLDGLRARNLLENTIVVITGDHGEEFMEKGRWGHNSAFTEEQTRVPLVLWVPGTGSSVVARMTSHLDLAPTILRAVGVTNPAEDYSLGMDLLGEEQRDFTVIAGWSSVCRVDRWRKETFGFSARSALSNHEPLRDKDDAVLETDPDSGTPRSERLLNLMVASGRFAGGK